MNLRPSPLAATLCASVLFLLTVSAQCDPLIDAGMPASGREWTGTDYQQVAEILSANKVPLPTLATPEGRAFIQRLTSTENLGYYRNTGLPLGVRLDDLVKCMQASSGIVMQYVKAANQGQKVNTEAAMELSFMLHVAESGIILIDEFLPNIPKDDTYETRMAGLKKMYGGLTTMFVGSETSLGETNFYTKEDLSMLLQAMTDVLPTVKKAFPDGYAAELRQKLTARKASFPAPKDTANLQKMIEELGR